MDSSAERNLAALAIRALVVAGAGYGEDFDERA